MNPAVAIEISVAGQSLHVIRGGKRIRSFRISTALRGVGFAPGSYRTPTGSFEIAELIGGNSPAGTVFKGRKPVGIWSPGQHNQDDLILTRILRLRGLEAWNANSWDRYIYIHGTNHEDQLGKPVSHGCIRMSNRDVAELFDMVRPGTAVNILSPKASDLRMLVIDAGSPETAACLLTSKAADVFNHLTHGGWTVAIAFRDQPSLHNRSQLFNPSIQLIYHHATADHDPAPPDDFTSLVQRLRELTRPRCLATASLLSEPTRGLACSKARDLSNLPRILARNSSRKHPENTITFYVTDPTFGLYTRSAMSNGKKNQSKGKRYSPAEKAAILDFVEAVNKKKGRGGQKSAAEKYGVSPLTISNWLKASKKGGAKKATAKKVAKKAVTKKIAKKVAKKAAAKKVARKRVAKKAAKKAIVRKVARKRVAKKAAGRGAGFAGKLNKLVSLHADITKAEAALAGMKAEFAKLKGSL